MTFLAERQVSAPGGRGCVVAQQEQPPIPADRRLWWVSWHRIRFLAILSPCVTVCVRSLGPGVVRAAAVIAVNCAVEISGTCAGATHRGWPWWPGGQPSSSPHWRHGTHPAVWEAFHRLFGPHWRHQLRCAPVRAAFGPPGWWPAPATAHPGTQIPSIPPPMHPGKTGARAHAAAPCSCAPSVSVPAPAAARWRRARLRRRSRRECLAVGADYRG